MSETEEDRHPEAGLGVVRRRSSSGRWLLAATAAVVVAVVGSVLVASRGDDDKIDVVAGTAADSPFVGMWRSTGNGSPPQTMYIDRWDTNAYHVSVGDEAGRVCAGLGQLASDRSLVVARLARPANSAEPSSCDRTGSTRPRQPRLELTLDESTEPDQLVDSSGGVWHKQPAPPPDAEDAALLQTFLAARVAGQGAEQHVGRHLQRDDRMPLLYANTSGAAYERFEIERVQDEDRGARYTVRLFTAGGTMVEQGLGVFDGVGDQDGQRVVAYSGPTLEDGRAVLLPFDLHDGEVRFGVSSTWDVEWVDDAVGSFRHRFLTGAGSQGSAIVIAAEPLSVGAACINRPAPADAKALARNIVSGSGHEVSDPVPVRIAGIDGLQVDVAVADGAVEFLCTFEESRTLGGIQSGGNRMRLYLLDRPGDSRGVVTIAVMSHPDEFHDTIAEVAPILNSVDIPLD
jgi:hypothetical protein